MGFLDNTTNQIVLDAVLTDAGRAALSRNDGSFRIRKFALCDDEVNYGIIEKYGRSVGAEKIIKNTPILEANTSPSLGIKYPLVSVSNDSLVYLPSLVLTDTRTTIYTNSASQKTTNVLITQQTNNDQTIDIELQDMMFIVSMNNMFLQMSNESGAALYSVDADQMATYRIPAQQNARTSAGGTSVLFTLAPKSIPQSMFDVYGVGGQITTYVKVTGMQSGASTEFEITITT